MSLSPPQSLRGDHDLGAFDCGHDEPNDWLRRRALNSEGRSARTYVVTQGAQVVGYYAMAAGSVLRGEMPKKLSRNTPEPVPILVLGRLAVDKRHGKRGIGRGLVKDALLRAASVAGSIGVRALVVHAIDDRAAAFWRRMGFLPSPLNPMTFMLPVGPAGFAV